MGMQAQLSNAATMPDRPVRPRDAASLLIHRGHGRDIEVLMGRRRSRARFMPDVYVFPGGSLDKQDYPAGPLTVPPEYTARVATGNCPRRAVALAVAAVREAREETGLTMLTGSATPDLQILRYIGRAITPTASPVRFHARFFAASHEHFAGTLGGDGELLDLRWVPATNHAALPLVDVTEFMLAELARVLTGQHTQTPLMSYRGEATRIRYR